MSPESIGVIIGLAFTLPTIYFVRRQKFDSWAWPIFLVSLPIWYMAFGLLALDGKVMLSEVIVGLPYIVTGFLVWKIKFRFAYYVLGIAWLSHGLYDYYHDVFFVNPGVFSWYPAFCAVVDVLVGAYIVLNAKQFDGVPARVSEG
ncbi:MAG: hypothetical protein ABJK25_04215 [Halieaceae bacterium]